MMILFRVLAIAMMVSSGIAFGMEGRIPREDGFYTQLGMNEINTNSSMPVLDAVIHNNLEDLMVPLTSGYDINATGDVHRVNGEGVGLKDVNALMVTAIYGRPRIMKYLLRNHAALNCVDALGNTALMMAAWHGRTSLVRLLVQFGADVTIRNKAGLNALQEAENSPLIKERPHYYNNSKNYKFTRMCNVLKRAEDDKGVCHNAIKFDAHKRHNKVEIPALRKVNNSRQRSYCNDYNKKDNNCSKNYSLIGMSEWPKLGETNNVTHYNSSVGLNKSIGTQVGLAVLGEENNFASMKKHSGYYNHNENILCYWNNGCCYFMNS